MLQKVLRLKVVKCDSSKLLPKRIALGPKCKCRVGTISVPVCCSKLFFAIFSKIMPSLKNYKGQKIIIIKFSTKTHSSNFCMSANRTKLKSMKIGTDALIQCYLDIFIYLFDVCLFFLLVPITVQRQITADTTVT